MCPHIELYVPTSRAVCAHTLDEGLPRAYDKPLYEAKVDAVFEHFYEAAA